jgi:aldose 1-epimerase
MKKIAYSITAFIFLATIFGCTYINKTKEQQPASIKNGVEKTEFGTMPDGRKAYLYTLKNEKGLIAKITNY